MTKFAVGDRVLYNAEPGDRLNGYEVAGEIINIVHNLALIRPDNCATSGIMVTTRHTRDIRRKEASGEVDD